jgi:hypothetical protein
MVRRAQLQRKPGSPLISGYLTPKGIRWRWVLAALVVAAAVAGVVWYVWLR